MDVFRKGIAMRRACATVFMIAMLLAPGPLLAQEELTSEQLRRMYDDAIAQGKATQDRRNELARDNEKLRLHIAELEKKLEEAQAKLTEVADSTFHARSRCAAIEEFLQANPSIRGQWLVFLQRNTIPSANLSQFLDVGWPFRAAH